MEFEILSKLGKQLFEGFRKALRRFQPSKETGYFLMVFLNETINVHSTLLLFHFYTVLLLRSFSLPWERKSINCASLAERQFVPTRRKKIRLSILCALGKPSGRDISSSSTYGQYHRRFPEMVYRVLKPRGSFVILNFSYRGAPDIDCLEVEQLAR
jgi:hypothetical protein